MHINYLSDSIGNTIAVQIPVDEWRRLKDKYPDIDDSKEELAAWQKTLIDQRLQMVTDNPDSLQELKGTIDDEQESK